MHDDENSTTNRTSLNRRRHTFTLNIIKQHNRCPCMRMPTTATRADPFFAIFTTADRCDCSCVCIWFGCCCAILRIHSLAGGNLSLLYTSIMTNSFHKCLFWQTVYVRFVLKMQLERNLTKCAGIYTVEKRCVYVSKLT